MVNRWSKVLPVSAVQYWLQIMFWNFIVITLYIIQFCNVIATPTNIASNLQHVLQQHGSVKSLAASISKADESHAHNNIFLEQIRHQFLSRPRQRGIMNLAISTHTIHSAGVIGTCTVLPL